MRCTCLALPQTVNPTDMECPLWDFSLFNFTHTKEVLWCHHCNHMMA